MQSSAARKEAVRKFKERKTLKGIFAIRCLATNQVWVGSSRNIEATRNGSWFQLRTGSHRDQALQQAWNRHEEQAFQYQILEQADDDLPLIALEDVLKARKQYWLGTLGALPL